MSTKGRVFGFASTETSRNVHEKCSLKWQQQAPGGGGLREKKGRKGRRKEGMVRVDSLWLWREGVSSQEGMILGGAGKIGELMNLRKTSRGGRLNPVSEKQN
jgi:hypothetical protein